MEIPKARAIAIGCDLGYYHQYGSSRLLGILSDLNDELEVIDDPSDIEHIHRARVASRRLRAGLDLFRECFDHNEIDRWSGEVRSLTRALGRARDLDVQIEFLGGYIDENGTNPFLDGLNADLRQDRMEAQSKVVRKTARLRKGRTMKEMRDTFSEGSAKTDREIPLDTYERAFRHVSDSLDALLALQRYVHMPEEIERHHEQRIAAKRLRYTLELLDDLYDGMVKEDIQRIKGLQELLGEMHDCDVWIDLLTNSEVAGKEALLLEMTSKRGSTYALFVASWDALAEAGFFKGMLDPIAPGTIGGERALDRVNESRKVREEALFHWDDAGHSIHVGELALMLFDGLMPLHGLGQEERQMLEYASILHDVGWREGGRGHHKASMRVVLEDRELPFDDRERSVIACVARYHRGKLPKKGHEGYGTLAKRDREIVDRLASILRIADSLDVSHSQMVRSLECRICEGCIQIILAASNPTRELESFEGKKGLFERTFGRKIEAVNGECRE